MLFDLLEAFFNKGVSRCEIRCFLIEEEPFVLFELSLVHEVVANGGEPGPAEFLLGGEVAGGDMSLHGLLISDVLLV